MPYSIGLSGTLFASQCLSFKDLIRINDTFVLGCANGVLIKKMSLFKLAFVKKGGKACFTLS